MPAAGRHGLHPPRCGVYANVIRFLAAAHHQDELLKEGLDILEKVLRKAVSAA